MKRGIGGSVTVESLYMLVDVRTPSEFKARHAEGATNIPLEDLEAGKIGVLVVLEKNTLVQIYCRRGGRASRAQELLAERGFTNVQNLGGLHDVLRLQSGPDEEWPSAGDAAYVVLVMAVGTIAMALIAWYLLA